MSREWTDEELSLIDATPKAKPRGHRLTPEQVQEIRQRVDSMSVPWTIAELARMFHVHQSAISRIARRRRWAQRAYEPGNRPWWRER